MADDFQPRRVDLGRVNERYFMFSSGVGLDASVVERVDAHPLPQGALRRVVLHLRRGLDVQPPATSSTRRTCAWRRPARTLEGVTVIVQNSDPYTYFGRRPIRVGEGAGLDTARWRSPCSSAPRRSSCRRCVPRLFSGRAKTVLRHRQIESLGELATREWRPSTSGRSRCRSTATTSASTARSSSRRCRARCWRLLIRRQRRRSHEAVVARCSGVRPQARRSARPTRRVRGLSPSA